MVLKALIIDGTLNSGSNNIFITFPALDLITGDIVLGFPLNAESFPSFVNSFISLSPVIKSNAGNVINLETITVGERVAMAGNQVSNMKYGGTDYGKFIFTNKKEQSNTVYLNVYSNDTFVIRGPASNTIKKKTL